jgi:hypothetical protein
MEKAWAGAAYYLTLYMLASHVSRSSKKCLLKCLFDTLYAC